MSELNLMQRMSKITTELKAVGKNLEVQVSKTNKYKAVSERDILDAVKPIEAKYGVYSYPVEREILREETQEREGQYGVRKDLFTRIKTVYRFVNADKPVEFIDMVTYADGIDSGDKGMGKAMTYADKYALMKAYKISTGDDPDQEASTEMKEHKEYKATEKQVKAIYGAYDEERLSRMLAYYKVEKVEDLSVKQASEAIKNAKVQ